MQTYLQYNGIDYTVQNIDEASLLTVVLPIRMSSNRLDLLERLELVKLDHDVPNDISFLVVDDGSPRDCSEKIKEKAEELGFSYVRLNTDSMPWCLARARNFSAMLSNSKYIMYQDVDLMPYEGFYNSVLTEIKISNMENDISEFLMFGVVYLNEEASKDFSLNPSVENKERYINKLYENSCEIEKFSTGTSVTVFNREYYLIRGGQNEQFVEWGYEDIEFMLRCIRVNKKFPLPDNFLDDYRNFSQISEYNGWKSVYRLFGDMTFSKGKCMFHYWHPVYPFSRYQLGKERNRKIFEKVSRDFAVNGVEPEPLPDLSKKCKTLIFRDNPYVYSREIRPKLGRVVFVHESDFETVDELFEFVDKECITRILFHNPYANNRMRHIYNVCRDKEFPYVVSERGGLRNSIIFDKTGFLADSKMFAKSLWKKTLSEDSKDSVREYIAEELSSDSHLEKQGFKLGLDGARRKLKINRGKKVLFVPLQRPSDTVIKNHAKAVGGYEGFIKLVTEVKAKLGPDWVVVAKKHPLEDERPNISGVIYAPDDMHVHDLIEVSNWVMLINSGVGLLSMLLRRPVVITGESYYSVDGVNFSGVCSDEIVKEIHSDFRFNDTNMYSFIHYLLNEYYSFGEFKTREVRLDDGAGSRITATSGIDFNVIRGLDDTELNIVNRKSAKITRDSILLDRYRHFFEIKDKQALVQKERIPEVIASESIIESPVELKSSISKKTKKFVKSPHAFFSDSKSPFFRLISKVI